MTIMFPDPNYGTTPPIHVMEALYSKYDKVPFEVRKWREIDGKMVVYLTVGDNLHDVIRVVL